MKNFLDSIKTVYIQFEEKLENRYIDDTKTKILNFYVEKININLNKFSILSYDDINKLMDLYNCDGF